MLNATMQSTKSGGPLAAAWAVVNTIGDSGYADLAGQVFEAVDRIVAGIGGPLRVVVPPDSTLVALAATPRATRSRSATRWPRAGGTSSRRCPSAALPPTIHLSVSAATLASVDDFLSALGASVAAAVAEGPVHVDADVVAFIEALDPAGLSDEDFDGLLAASGLVGSSGDGDGLALPERMAEVNALLDVASRADARGAADRLPRPALPPHPLTQAAG